jgi:hypothetical protein
MTSNNHSFQKQMKQHFSSETPLPANNISQQLFFKTLPDCENHLNNPKFVPAPSCNRTLQLQTFYNKTPTNLWDTASNYQGGPGFNAATDVALARQGFMSQYFNYVSGNNVTGDDNYSSKSDPFK